MDQKKEGGGPLIDRRTLMLGGLAAAATYVTYKIPDYLDELVDKSEIERLRKEISEKYGIEIEVPTDSTQIQVGIIDKNNTVGDDKYHIKSAYAFAIRGTLEGIRAELQLYPPEYLYAIGLKKIVIGSRMSGVLGLAALGSASRTGEIGLYVGLLTNPLLFRVYGTLHHELGHLLHLKFVEEFSMEWSKNRTPISHMKEDVANLTETMFAIYLDNHRRTIKPQERVVRGDEAFQKETLVKIAVIKKYMERSYPLMNSEFWDDVIHGRVGPNYWDERQKNLTR